MIGVWTRRYVTVTAAVLVTAMAASVLSAQPRGRRPEDLWTSDAEAARAQYHAIARGLGVQGEVRGGARAAAYVVTIPRDDLRLIHSGMPVPPEAGIESRLSFWRCPCGKLLMHGQLAVTEAERPAVVAALEAERAVLGSRGRVPPPVVAGDAVELFPGTEPRVFVMRVHGEGDPNDMARALRRALDAPGLIATTRSSPATRPASTDDDAPHAE